MGNCIVFGGSWMLNGSEPGKSIGVFEPGVSSANGLGRLAVSFSSSDNALLNGAGVSLIGSQLSDPMRLCCSCPSRGVIGLDPNPLSSDPDTGLLVSAMEYRLNGSSVRPKSWEAAKGDWGWYPRENPSMPIWCAGNEVVAEDTKERLSSSSSSSTLASFSRQRLHTRIMPSWPNREPLMMLEAQREQNIWPADAIRGHKYREGEGHTTYTTMMLPSPCCEYALAIITLFAVLIIHPIILGEACATHETIQCQLRSSCVPSPRIRLITFDTDPDLWRLPVVLMLRASSWMGNPGIAVPNMPPSVESYIGELNMPPRDGDLS